MQIHYFKEENCKADQENKITKKLANKLYGYSQLAVQDMKTIFKRVKTLSMKHALKDACDKCSSCKST